MRDPARIEPILDALRERWLRNPDLRLMQLLGNLADDLVRRPDFNEPHLSSEAYNVEDDRVLAILVMSNHLAASKR